MHACVSINISHFLLGLSDQAAMQRVSLQLCSELLEGSILHVLLLPFLTSPGVTKSAILGAESARSRFTCGFAPTSQRANHAGLIATILTVT